jgi:hypothetical protein
MIKGNSYKATRLPPKMLNIDWPFGQFPHRNPVYLADKTSKYQLLFKLIYCGNLQPTSDKRFVYERRSMSKAIQTLCIATTVLASYAHAGMEDAYNKTRDSKKIAVMDKGQATLKSKLKNPDSAKFKNVFFHIGIENVPMTCGEVSYKDEKGKTTRYQRFMSAGRPEYTHLQHEQKEFAASWRQFCQ